MAINWTDNEAAGLLPLMLDVMDPRGAVEQLHEAYAHGGGWRDFAGFTLLYHSDGSYGLAYPGDPAMRELSRTYLPKIEGQRGFETVVLFEFDWVAVIQQGGAFKCARMD